MKFVLYCVFSSVENQKKSKLELQKILNVKFKPFWGF